MAGPRLGTIARSLLGRVAQAAAASSSANAAPTVAGLPAMLGVSVPRQATAWGLLSARRYSLPAHTVLTMPSLSPTMTQGNIATWLKKEGDQITPGTVLAEVETDKATIEWEAQEEGYLAKILKPDGSKDIEVGAPVAVLAEEADNLAAFKDFSPEGGSGGGGGGGDASKSAPPPPKPAESKPAAKPSEAKAAPAKPKGGSFPPHQVLNMPALSPTMSQGNISEWKKKVGDQVAPGDVYAEVETDKATISWESQEEGYIAQILLPDGAKDVEIGTPAIVLVEEKDKVDAFKNFTAADASGGGQPSSEASSSEAPAAEPSAAPEPQQAAPQEAPAPSSTSEPAPSDGRVKASPYARKLASESGVDLSGLKGSGPGGRIVAEDVQGAGGKPKAAPAAAGAKASGAAAARAPAAAPAREGQGYTDIPHTQIRRITAQRLLESKQTVPHYYLTSEIKMDSLLKLREQLNASFPKDSGMKLSVNDFIIKAAALACKKVPGVNASWQADVIRQFHYVDVSVAVQTPIGLLTPIVRDADVKGLAAISSDVKTLAKKAKDGKLGPAEFTGGTFTISNLGMYGVKQFCAIINPPQAAILAVGTTDKKVVIGKDGDLQETSVMQATLSCDHRVVDGAMGAEWLQAFRAYLEVPGSMLL